MKGSHFLSLSSQFPVEEPNTSADRATNSRSMRYEYGKTGSNAWPTQLCVQSLKRM